MALYHVYVEKRYIEKHLVSAKDENEALALVQSRAFSPDPPELGTKGILYKEQPVFDGYIDSSKWRIEEE
jgi:hypothetical protein